MANSKGQKSGDRSSHGGCRIGAGCPAKLTKQQMLMAGELYEVRAAEERAKLALPILPDDEEGREWEKAIHTWPLEKRASIDGDPDWQLLQEARRDYYGGKRLFRIMRGRWRPRVIEEIRQEVLLRTGISVSGRTIDRAALLYRSGELNLATARKRDP